MIPKVEMGPVKLDYQKMKRLADKATDKATVKSLIFLRRRASTNVLRRRKTASKPGAPPHVHASNQYASLRNIRWVYYGKGAGVVGPVRLNQVNETVEMGRQTVPEVLEKGGTIKVREIRRKFRGPSGEERWTKWRRRDMRRRVDKRRSQLRIRNVRIAPRPFMIRALEIEVREGNIISKWAGVFNE